MKKFCERFSKFMIGRYGMDRLGQFLTVLALVFILAGFFVRSLWLDGLALICLILCYYRMFSRNISRRFQENQKYEAMRFHTEEFFKRLRFRIDQARHYHIYKCPGCGQKIRIPRGKGRVSIHCPKCGKDFIKKS